MLELKTKWFTNTLAKASLLNKDYIHCENNLRLYIIGYGDITNSGKNTYNYQLRDDSGVVLSEGSNAYLDKLTTLIKGENPKSKEKKENNNQQNSNNMKSKKSTLVSEFVKLRNNLKKATLAFNEFQTKHNVTTLEDVETLDATIAKNNEKIEVLKKALEMAKSSNNELLIAAIEAMIREKTK